MTRRIYNFGAGPAMLPEDILREAQEQLLDWQGLGVSILEINHRSPQFLELIANAEQTFRQLLHIPMNYKILFLGGAARTQFAMIPLNLLHPKEKGTYLISGIWSQMAYQEAIRIKEAYCFSTTENDEFKSIPEPGTIRVPKDSQYLYYAPNETVNGIRIPYIPNSHGKPLIADMTSCLLSEPIDIRNYGLVFAGAQKNIAPAGLTLVIVREDLLDRMPEPQIPNMLSYKVHTDYQSIYATPPVFNIYIAAKMFEWVKKQGGVEAIYRLNCLKAAKLYQYLDSSTFYSTAVDPKARSLMNICFFLKNKDLEPKFIAEAEKRGLYALKGHKLVGGIRASLYNAMPMSGVDALIEFMQQFAWDNS